MVGTTLGHYRIDAELGRGGMGVVYRAFDMRLDRAIAIKVLPPHLAGSLAARERFVHEAKTASSLDHPSICTIHDIGETGDGSTFIVMPFYEGQTLRQRLSSGAIVSEDVIRFADQIADGLAAAHAAGIVHRDIKPANLLITESGRVKILDFGLAKMEGHDALTRDGSTVGTTFYMSPEQIRGGKATSTSDLWSLGVVLYEMACGRRPFRGDYEAAASYAIVNEDPDPLPESVPAAVSELVASLLKKDPADRPASAAVVRDRLGSFERAVAPPQSHKGPARRWIIAAGAIALVLLAGVIAILTNRPTPEPEPLDAMVVFPFDIQAGADLEYLGRGMVSMLSPMIDGVGGIRAVDPKAVLGLLEQRDDRFVGPDEGRLMASEFRASRYVLGSISRLGSRLQLAATLYDASGEIVADHAELVETEDELLDASHRLLISLLGAALETEGSVLSAELLSTTESFAAMKAYVRADEAYRAGRFDDSRDLADEAIAEDSTFAAALHLAANARGQMLEPSGSLRRAALRHADGAPPRLRAHIEIRGTPGLTRLEGVERMKALLERYPDDIDALGYVADQTYHGIPQVGGSTTEAIPLFLDVLRFDPDNGEYLWHLAPILYRERRFDTLDSLYRALSAQTSLSVDHPVPQYYAVWAARNLALGDRRAMLDSIVQRSSEDPQFFAAALTFMEGQDLAAAHYVMDQAARVSPNVPDSVSLHFEQIKSMIGLLRGGIDAWRADLSATQWRDSGYAAAARVFAATSVMHWPVTADSLIALARLLESPPDRAGLMHSLVWLEEVRYPGFERDLGSYFRTLIAERVGDVEAMRRELELMVQPAEEEDAHWMTRNVRHETEARVHLASGRLEEALGAVDRREIVQSSTQQFSSPWHAGIHARFLRARILLELGRYEEAIAWSRSVHESLQAFPPVLLPSTYQLEATAYERLQDWEAAIERYDRLLTLWSDADPIMQPQVEEIRRRREQAIGRMAGERGT